MKLISTLKEITLQNPASLTWLKTVQTLSMFALLFFFLGNAAHAAGDLGAVQQQGIAWLTVIKNILYAIALLTVTIALMVAGFKMIVNHHRWSEVMNIVLGGLFIGFASAIGGWLIPGQA